MKIYILIVCISFVTNSRATLNEIEKIGKDIFFDKSLSNPEGQSCASCHIPENGFANNQIVSPGANTNLFGNRNTPTIAYSSFSPSFKYDNVEGNLVPVGGQFMDGRADNLAQQALGPLLNPLEMGNKTIGQIVTKIKKTDYWKRFKKVFRKQNKSDEDIINNLTTALAAYESSYEVARFTSKYDYWLQGKANLSTLELQGFTVFERPDKGNCASCHTLKKKHKYDTPLFTDFTYDNIGVPVNPSNPYYSLDKNYNPFGDKYIDYGLGKSSKIKEPRYLGMFKVPTLRNIELTSPYMHNGVFKTLREVVEFYNSRNTESKWGKPEVSFNINQTELGNLNLNELDMDALVAFMKTLTDGYEYEK